MKYLLTFLFTMLITTNVNGTVTEGGEGMLFGNNHAFKITATTGWVLDNQNAVSQGIHMAFYPKHKTWANSPVIMYGRSISTSQMPNIKSQVDQTVRDFHKNNSPNYKAEKRGLVSLFEDKKAEIYYFSGDQWGNYEAVAYVQEKDTINYLVFNSREKKSFDKYIGDFYKIVSSYRNVYTPPSEITKEHLKSLRNESSRILSKLGGKEYEGKATKHAVMELAQSLSNCATYYGKKKLPPFRYLVRINNQGNISESFVYPTNALSSCFKGAVSDITYPSHSFGSFVLDIDMKIEPLTTSETNGKRKYLGSEHRYC